LGLTNAEFFIIYEEENMSKEVLTYELKIDAIINEATRELNAFGKSIENTWKNGEPTKHLLKSMEIMRQRLGSLKEISKKGVVDSSDLA
jgi:hypothetical protein